MINIQSALLTSPDWCKIVFLAMSFVSNGNLCIDCTQLDICVCVCVCVCVCYSQYGEAGWGKKKNKHIGTTVNAACQGKLSACYFGHARLWVERHAAVQRDGLQKSHLINCFEYNK